MAEMAEMADPVLESRLARLESELAYIRSNIAQMERREERARDDRIWLCEQIAFGVFMLVVTAAILGGATHGFR